MTGYRLDMMWLVCCMLAVCLCSACGAETALYVKGELLASEDFGKGLSNWLPEGDIVARIEKGKLYFEATTKTNVKKGNVWWKKHFEGNILIEYEYQSLSENGLSMVFFMSDGRDGKDLFSYKRSGVYDEYIAGKMNGYHISYHRFGSGVSNFRKSFGFHVVASATEPIPAKDLKPHKITIHCQGRRVRFLVDGKVVHDFVDEGKPCLSKTRWKHQVPCRGTGPHFTAGKIGLRHTQKQRAYYDNFKVWRLVKPGGNASTGAGGSGATSSTVAATLGNGSVKSHDLPVERVGASRRQ